MPYIYLKIILTMSRTFWVLLHELYFSYATVYYCILNLKKKLRLTKMLSANQFNHQCFCSTIHCSCCILSEAFGFTCNFKLKNIIWKLKYCCPCSLDSPVHLQLNNCLIQISSKNSSKFKSYKYLTFTLQL